MQTWLNRSRWVVDSDGPKEACVAWGCILAPPDEYDCDGGVAFLSNYFDHLLLFIYLFIVTVYGDGTETVKVTPLRRTLAFSP